MKHKTSALQNIAEDSNCKVSGLAPYLVKTKAGNGTTAEMPVGETIDLT